MRFFTILHLVASRRSGAKIGRATLAHACECTPKTIQRDIDDLRAAFIPIEYDPSERTYFLPEKGWKLSLVTLTTSDAMALALLRSLYADTHSALPFATEIAQALEKATAGLSPALRSLMESVSVTLDSRNAAARDYSHAPIRLLLNAAARQRTVEMLYESRSSQSTRRRLVDPYRLQQREGRYLELDAWCHTNKEVRTFALDRIQEARLTEATFERRAWTPRDEGVVGGLRGNALARVEVRFDGVVAPFARERLWPFAATFEEMGDAEGSVILRGEVQGVEGITRELLSWRRHATVLGGPELRARFVEEVRAMANLYDED